MLEEKQQLAKDLSDMERSFSDVVKRLDRRKEVIDGFKKVRCSLFNALMRSKFAICLSRLAVSL